MRTTTPEDGLAVAAVASIFDEEPATDVAEMLAACEDRADVNRILCC